MFRLFSLQISMEVQEELLLLLRSQQRELDELRQSQQELLQRLTGHMDAVQSSMMAHVEHVLHTQQEQGRILPLKGAWQWGCRPFGFLKSSDGQNGMRL